MTDGDETIMEHADRLARPDGGQPVLTSRNIDQARLAAVLADA